MNTVHKERTFPGGQLLQLVRGDITLEDVDAIVNAANARLKHGGGVARAISKRGGPIIQKESDQWVRVKGPVTHESPAWTSGGALPARYVIHAVGPVWGAGDEDAKLAAAVTGSLRVADQLGLHSVAMPAISTGIFGFPKERAAGVMITAIHSFFEEVQGSTLEQVKLVIYDDPTLAVFEAIWET